MSSMTSILTQQTYDTNYIHSQYKETISDLIAYIEVYEHDLPAEIMAQIAELFQTVALCEREKNSAHDCELSNLLLMANLKIKQSLYKHAICLFIKKIQEYKRIFKRFNYKGVRLDDNNFAIMAKEREKDIIKNFSRKLRICYQNGMVRSFGSLSLKDLFLYIVGYVTVCIFPFFYALRREPYLPVDNLIADCMEEVDLENTYKSTKVLLKKYEEVSPLVISNGANQSLGMSIFIAVSSWIIPIILGIPILINIINVVNDFISKME